MTLYKSFDSVMLPLIEKIAWDLALCLFEFIFMKFVTMYLGSRLCC